MNEVRDNIDEGNRLARLQSMKNSVSRVIDDNVEKVKEYRAGNTGLVGWFLSQAMETYREDQEVNTNELLDMIKGALNDWQEPMNDGHYVKTVSFERDMIPFKEGEVFEFRKGVNLLVGDQGCGKSTIIHVMMYEDSEYDGVANIKRSPFRGDYVFLDTEKHNPRNLAGESGGRTDIAAVREYLIHSKEVLDAPIDWLEKSNEYMKRWLDKFGGEKAQLDNHIISKFKSHGETLLPMLQQFIDKKSGLIYIDEPETALSMRSQYKFVETIKSAVEKKNQVFIATHSRIIMEGLTSIMDEPAVLSLEHRCWMSPENFIKSQLSDV